MRRPADRTSGKEVPQLEGTASDASSLDFEMFSRIILIFCVMSAAFATLLVLTTFVAYAMLSTHADTELSFEWMWCRVWFKAWGFFFVLGSSLELLAYITWFLTRAVGRDGVRSERYNYPVLRFYVEVVPRILMAFERPPGAALPPSRDANSGREKRGISAEAERESSETSPPTLL